MGKALIIDGADFSQVAVDNIYSHFNPIGVVDLTQYSNLLCYIQDLSAGTPYLTGKSTGSDAYIIPVAPGETYSIKAIVGNGTLIVGNLDGDSLDIESNIVTNVTQIIGAGAQQWADTENFAIPTGCNYIFISGRNVNNPNYNPNYLLTLTRLS